MTGPYQSEEEFERIKAAAVKEADKLTKHFAHNDKVMRRAARVARWSAYLQQAVAAIIAILFLLFISILVGGLMYKFTMIYLDWVRQ